MSMQAGTIRYTHPLSDRLPTPHNNSRLAPLARFARSDHNRRPLSSRPAAATTPDQVGRFVARKLKEAHAARSAVVARALKLKETPDQADVRHNSNCAMRRVRDVYLGARPDDPRGQGPSHPLQAQSAARR